VGAALHDTSPLNPSKYLSLIQHQTLCIPYQLLPASNYKDEKYSGNLLGYISPSRKLHDLQARYDVSSILHQLVQVCQQFTVLGELITKELFQMVQLVRNVHD